MVEKTSVQRAVRVTGSQASLAELNEALVDGWMVAATVPLDNDALVILEKAVTEDERTKLKQRVEKLLAVAVPKDSKS